MVTITVVYGNEMKKEELDRIKELVVTQMIDSLGYLLEAFQLSAGVCLVIVSAVEQHFDIKKEALGINGLPQFAPIKTHGAKVCLI